MTPLRHHPNHRLWGVAQRVCILFHKSFVTFANRQRFRPKCHATIAYHHPGRPPRPSESQYGGLWVQPDFNGPTNFFSHCPEDENKSSSPFCGLQDYLAPDCSHRSKSRKLFYMLTLQEMIKRTSSELTHFSRLLELVRTFREPIHPNVSIPVLVPPPFDIPPEVYTMRFPVSTQSLSSAPGLVKKLFGSRSSTKKQVPILFVPHRRHTLYCDYPRSRH